LTDILSRREFLYKNFFSSKGFSLALPPFMVASPVNPLLIELQNLYNFTDPINISSESSRELLYHSGSYVTLLLFKDICISINQKLSKLPINFNILQNYFFIYMFGKNNAMFDFYNNADFYKNQYRPMKKGVSNMIRLHATGAIAMPIETRLHLLASSKDVIHSWAIPSAGVKIDCVPGYSSHRIMIFLVSGIFWGQCMEICGRFHH
jgi:heme/copper-type cytochrome/quinol oxidase subunit 2